MLRTFKLKPDFVRQVIQTTVPSLLLAASFLLLRHQVTQDLSLEFAQAWKAGLYVGWMADLAASLLPLAVALFLQGAGHVPLRWSFGIFASLFWIGVLANVIHFRYFHTSLALWVIEDHWRDLTMVHGSATNLGGTWPLILSAACVVSSVVVMAKTQKRGERRAPLPGRGDWAKSLPRLGAGLGVLILALALRQSPVWFGWVFVGERHEGNVLTNQVLVQWWSEATKELAPTADKTPAERAAERIHATRTMAHYRDFSDQGLKAPDRKMILGSDWPLLYRFEPEASETLRLRKLLGLPESGPLNVLVLFLEGVRYFEIGHPVLGPMIFPEIRKVLAEHSIHFTQAYTSGLVAGQTVRGQFTTLCSNVDKVVGPATYISHYTVRVQCLPNFLFGHGYSTAWINGFKTTFHNKAIFESLHGMKRFYDRDYFLSRGVRKEIGDWGLADGPVLQETVNILESLKAPWFAHALTLSTHHPHSVIPDGPLPESLLKATADLPAYQGYLSRLRYSDQSVGDFFRKFLASPAADRTLVVFMADHGTPVPTHLPLTPEQEAEMQFRIPLALVTKNLPKAMRDPHPVHQADIAPTIATILGLQGNVSWLGGGLFAPEGRPWLYQAGDRIHYRTSKRGCYTEPGTSKPRCFDLADRGKDPMYDTKLREIPEDPALTEFFFNFVRDDERAITENWIAPPGVF